MDRGFLCNRVVYEDQGTTTSRMRQLQLATIAVLTTKVTNLAATPFPASGYDRLLPKVSIKLYALPWMH